jgi:hypothetical protein
LRQEARDVANAFAQAKTEGKFIQSFDNYEDLPDRVLVTRNMPASAIKRSP